MTKEVFEAFEGFRRPSATRRRYGDTIYAARTPGVGGGFAIPEDMGEQTTLAYANIAETLAHFGADTSHVVEQSAFSDRYGRRDRSAGGSQAGSTRDANNSVARRGLLPSVVPRIPLRFRHRHPPTPEGWTVEPA